MAEPNAIVSYGEPFNDSLQAVENILMCDDEVYPSLNFPESVSFYDFSVTPTRFLSTVVDPEIVHPSDPLFDLLNLDDEMFEEGFRTGTSRAEEGFQTGTSRAEEVFQTGTSGASAETNTDDNTSNGTNDFENPIQLSSWPLQVPTNTCSCVDVTKLKVHGRLGLICHAVLEKYGIDRTTNQSHEYKTFDFCKETMSRVKQFLAAYCKERSTCGYVMLPDPLSSFYEAVCVGLDWEDNVDTNDLIPEDSGCRVAITYLSYVFFSLPGNDYGFMATTPTGYEERTSTIFAPCNWDLLGSAIEVTLLDAAEMGFRTEEPREEKRRWSSDELGDHQTIQQDVETSSARLNNKKSKRTEKLTMKDLVDYFNTPIDVAAKKMHIRSIDRKISRRAKSLTSGDAKQRTHAQAKIDTLRQEITNIYAAFSV
ncbi:hypothetical protein L1887_03655 [Cichorium endivia]|nr:hypothetical protein L1887_03655 [Cichorium endivia]